MLIKGQDVSRIKLGNANVFVIPGEHAKNGEERVVMLNRVAREVIEKQRGSHAERVLELTRFSGRVVAF
jgi:integrase